MDVRTAPRVRHDEPTVRVGITTAIPGLLQSLGVDPVEVLAEIGLDPQVFADPSNEMSLSARQRLLGHCAARTGCKHFGLLIGQTGQLSSWGLLGFLVQHSPDVGTALNSVVRFTHLVVRGASTSLSVQGDLAIWGYEIHHPRVEATEQAGDGAIAMFTNVMRKLCGPQWKPVEVLFAHRAPDDIGPYRRFFQAPLRFDADQYGIVFHGTWLLRNLPDDDPELRRLLHQQIAAIEARFRENFAEQVRSVLRTALIAHHATADQIAALFSMHSRTLNRRLREFGTSFQELVDEVRFEIARQMLENSAMDVTQIAAALAYADASAFTRAFRRWSGTTPALWRTNRKSGAAAEDKSALSPRRAAD